MSDITLFLKRRHVWGDRIALYLCGIRSIIDFKWTILVTLITTLLNSFVLYINNQIVFDESKITMQLIIMFVIAKSLDELSSCILKSLVMKKDLELNKILGHILYYVNNVYFTASYAWKSKYTREDRGDSLNSILGMSYTLDNVFDAIETITSFLSLLIIGTMSSYHITFVIVAGTVIIQIQRQFFAFEFDYKSNRAQADIYDNMVANQFANQVDVDYSSPFRKLLDPDSYDPSIGVTAGNKNRIIRMANRESPASSIAKVIVLCLSAAYLYHVKNPKLLIFFMINHRTLHAIHRIQSMIAQKWNTNLLKTFEMLGDVADMSASRGEPKTISVNVDGRSMAIDDAYIEIRLQNIHQTIGLGDTSPIDPASPFGARASPFGARASPFGARASEQGPCGTTKKLSLDYKGIISITSDDKVILLNGRKGSGKSVTADILGGRYDGTVSDDMTCNLVQLSDEFRDIQSGVCYIRQCILDDYRNNTKNTIVMPLAELFPGGTYAEIHDYLKEFDVEHKMPAASVTDVLHVPLSTSERGLSPGEMQTIVFASQFWKIKMTKPKIIIMDEPERNVDLHVMIRFLKKILDDFHGIIILITHSNDIKRYLLPNITQMWNYHGNKEDGMLTFDIVKSKEEMRHYIDGCITE